MNKLRIVNDARSLAMRHWPEMVNKPGNCLYAAMSLMHVLDVIGIRAWIQAGTCYWPRLTPEQAKSEDDPIYSFGYEWEPNSFDTQVRIALDTLPEMHVWVAIPDTNEIVDLTSGQFPVQCQNLLKLDWPGIKPPDYFWCKVGGPEWPQSVQYFAKLDAVKLVDVLACRIMSRSRRV